MALGGVIFQYHCNDCHAAEQGYSAVGPLVQGWTPDMIRSLVGDLHRVRFEMPPWCGRPEEAELLTAYLKGIAPPRPRGMLPTQPGDQVMDPKMLIDTATPGLPAPVWFIELFKMLGFTLHMAPMNLWYAGMILAVLLHALGSEHGRRFSARLMTQMPVIVAMGVNLGIVPLLFVQLGYAKIFYPATVLMAWFWLAIIGC